jgi:hypothetical protein
MYNIYHHFNIYNSHITFQCQAANKYHNNLHDYRYTQHDKFISRQTTDSKDLSVRDITWKAKVNFTFRANLVSCKLCIILFYNLRLLFYYEMLLTEE